MKSEVPTIVDVAQVNNGVSVKFSDGTLALYPAFFLYASSELAEILNEEDGTLKTATRG